MTKDRTNIDTWPYVVGGSQTSGRAPGGQADEETIPDGQDGGSLGEENAEVPLAEECPVVGREDELC